MAVSTTRQRLSSLGGGTLTSGGGTLGSSPASGGGAIVSPNFVAYPPSGANNANRALAHGTIHCRYCEIAAHSSRRAPSAAHRRWRCHARDCLNGGGGAASRRGRRTGGRAPHRAGNLRH